MKPLAFDLRNAKKVHGDKNTSTFHLKNGHMITVAHAALPALQRKQLERMPMAEGGIASKDSDIFNNASGAINRNIAGKDKPDESGEDEFTGDDREALARGQSIQNGPAIDMGGGVSSKDIPSFADGGDVSPEDAAAYKEYAPDITPADVADLAAPLKDKKGNTIANMDASSPAAQRGREKDAAIVAQYPNVSSQDDITGAADTGGGNIGTIQANAMDAANQPASMPKASPNDPYGMNSYYQQQMQALNQQQAGAMQENTVNANVGRYKAGLEQQYQNAVQAPMQKFQASMAQLNDEGNKIASEVASGAIDPKHYVNNMSTGSKIATGLGLLAGGIFSGKSGQENPAFQAVQQHIQNDINAQKTNLATKQNLLSYNLAKTGNLFAAEKLTEFQTNSIFESKFRSAADQAQNQMEQAKNMQVAGLFGQKKAELAHQISVNQALIGGQPGQSDEQSFQNRMQFLRMNGNEKMADEMEKKHIPGLPGQASVPVTPANNDEWRTLTNLQKSYNDAQDYMNNSSRLGVGWQNANRAKGQSIMDAMTLNMGELADLKRFTPEEKKLYQARVPDLVGTHFTGQDQAMLGQLNKELGDKTNTFKGSLGYPTAQPQAPVQNSNNTALNWARANPKDPRASRILNKLGVKK